MLDPVLLPSFLNICPRAEYNSLFKVLNPFYAMALLKFSYGSMSNHTTTGSLNKSEVSMDTYIVNKIVF